MILENAENVITRGMDINVLVNIVFVLFPERDYFAFHCCYSLSMCPVKKPRQNLLDDAGAFFGLVYTFEVGLLTTGAPDAGFKRQSSFFPVNPGIYAIAIGKWAVFGGQKNAGIWAKLANHSRFLPEIRR